MTSFDSALADLNQAETELQARLAAVQEARTALQRVTNGSTSTGAQAGSGSGSGNGGSPPGPGRPPSTGARRGRKGTREDEAFTLIQRKPGITIPQIAKAMGIAPNYLYRVVPKLQKEGRVRKDGQGLVAIVS